MYTLSALSNNIETLPSHNNFASIYSLGHGSNYVLKTWAQAKTRNSQNFNCIVNHIISL